MHLRNAVTNCHKDVPTGPVPSRPKVASPATHGQDAPAKLPPKGGWVGTKSCRLTGFDPSMATDECHMFPIDQKQATNMTDMELRDKTCEIHNACLLFVSTPNNKF